MHLTHQVNVSRQITVDNGGSTSTSWQTVATAIPCLLVYGNPEPDPMATNAQTTQAKSRATLYTQAAVNIKPNDRLTVVRPATNPSLRLTVQTDRASVMGFNKESHKEWAVIAG